MPFSSQIPLFRRARPLAMAAALTVGAAAVTFVPIGTVEASQGELARNELADEITATADRALEALDRYEATGDAAAERTLAWHRAMTAKYTALQLGYDELQMVDAWSRVDLDRQRVVLAALSQVGVPYRTNSSVEDEGFDCSGLTSFAWGAADVELFRHSGTQISDAEDRSRETALPGDLIHYPGHVMLYLGVDDAIVHSVETGRTVEVDTISQRRRDSVSWGAPVG
ncbi:MAG: NlpC/P60 family protein [Actinomycetota bacterium]